MLVCGVGLVRTIGCMTSRWITAVALVRGETTDGRRARADDARRAEGVSPICEIANNIFKYNRYGIIDNRISPLKNAF